MSLSLALQVFLIAIILRLRKCRSRTQMILGENSGGQYDFLVVVFAESGVMNMLCTLWLLIFSVLIGPGNSNDGWVTELCYGVILAITPAVQVCTSPQFPLQLNLDFLVSGMLELSEHLLGAKGYNASWTDEPYIDTDHTTVAFQRQGQSVNNAEVSVRVAETSQA